MNILVVDDCRASARLLEAVLSDSWFVRVAHDAASAMAIAEEQLFDLVILDLQLPDMHGCELARELKADPRMSRVRMIAVSGSDRMEDIHRARAAGFDGFMIKPVSGAAVRKKVAALLSDETRH